MVLITAVGNKFLPARPNMATKRKEKLEWQLQSFLHYTKTHKNVLNNTFFEVDIDITTNFEVFYYKIQVEGPRIKFCGTQKNISYRPL